MKKLLAVFVALLLLALVAAGVEAQSGSGGYFDFESSVRIMQDLLVLDDVNIQDTVRIEGAVTTGNDVTVGDDLTVTDLLVYGKVRATKGVSQTLLADTTITNTYTYLPISAAGNIGTSAIATTTSTAGDILILENIANVSIVITDTGTTMLTGNITLGQYDTLGLMFDGTNWIQLYTSNN